MKNIKIVFIGPEHLQKDGEAFYRNLQALCNQYHLQLIAPPQQLFNPISTTEEGEQLAQKRFVQIKEADVILCDLNDYKKSVEPFNETGLAFGIAWSLRKKFYGYMSDKRTCIERWQFGKHKDDKDRWVDNDFDAILESGALNLMLESDGIIIEGTLEDALKEIAKEAA